MIAPGGSPQSALARPAAALAAVCVLALSVRLALAVALPNVVWSDEIFQTLEQAHRLVFGYGVVPWEFRTGARSWLLPGVLAGAMELGRWAGELAHVRAAQVLLSLLSLAPIGAAFAWARPRGPGPALAAAVASAFWFELVLFAPKALSEVVAAHVFVLALLLGSRADGRDRTVATGAALALTAALRIQLAPAVAIAAAFTCRRDLGRWRALALGAVPVVAGVALLEIATWGRPFHSYVATFDVNLFQGRSLMYGVGPWWDYFRMIWDAWSWGVLAIVALAALGARHRPDLAACALAIVGTHSIIQHKEYRFIHPALVLVIVLAALGTAEVVAWSRDRARLPGGLAAAAAMLVWIGGSWAAGARSPVWTQGRSSIEATRWASAPGLCGLALVGQHWAGTGGYTYLHRNVPVYSVANGEDLARAWGGFDAALVSPEYAGFLPGFAVERCWADVCVARRRGGCARVEAPTVNATLAARGE